MGSTTETFAYSTLFHSRKRAHHDMFTSADSSSQNMPPLQDPHTDIRNQPLSWISRLHFWQIYVAACCLTAGLLGKFENWVRHLVAQFREQNPPPSKRRRTSNSTSEHMAPDAVEQNHSKSDEQVLSQARPYSFDVQKSAVSPEDHQVASKAFASPYLRPQFRPKKTLAQIFQERRQSQQRIFSVQPHRMLSQPFNVSFKPLSCFGHESITTSGFARLHNRSKNLVDHKMPVQTINDDGHNELFDEHSAGNGSFPSSQTVFNEQSHLSPGKPHFIHENALELEKPVNSHSSFPGKLRNEPQSVLPTHIPHTGLAHLKPERDVSAHIVHNNGYIELLKSEQAVSSQLKPEKMVSTYVVRDDGLLSRHKDTIDDKDLQQKLEIAVSTDDHILKSEDLRKSHAHYVAKNNIAFEQVERYTELLQSTRSLEGVSQNLKNAKEERDRVIAEMRKLTVSEGPRIPSLSPVDLEMVNKALKPSSSKTPLISKFSIEIHSRDIMTLASPNWLNDEIVNFYASMITERSKCFPEMPKVYMFNTFFYPTLRRSGYKGVRKWTKRAKFNMMDMDMIIVPVHQAVHWCLSVINMQERRFEFWDSLGGIGSETFEALREYVAQESSGRIDLSQWTNYYPESNPKQKNGYDCGVFTCKTAECISRGALTNFDQSDMVTIRQWMVKEILDGRLPQASA